MEDGGWEMRDPPTTLAPNATTVMVVQGLDFFAEVPTLDDQMPPARGAANAAVLVLRDLRTVTSTTIKCVTLCQGPERKRLRADVGRR